MFNYEEAKNSELLRELSEQEQENALGGFSMNGSDGLGDFFFQHTDIASFANGGYNDSHNGISSFQNTGYMLSQTTMGFSFPMFGFGFSGSGTGRRNGNYSMSIGNIFRLFLSLLNYGL